MLHKKDKGKILFFRESSFKVAELIFNNPNSTYHIRGIGKITRLSTTAVIQSIEDLQEFRIDRPVVGIAKGQDRKKNEFIFVEGKGKSGKRKDREFVKWVYGNTKLLIQVRDEAHRFAIQYQRQLRKIIHK